MHEFTRRDDLPAGLDPLWATFGDPAYARQKYLALGSRAVRIPRFDVSVEAIEVELERQVLVDRRAWPRWSRPALAAQQTLRHRSAWRRVTPSRIVATLEIAPVGQPVRADGAAILDEVAPEHAVMTVRWRVHSPLPLLGPRIERLFAQQLRAALDADHAFTLRYLAAQAGGRAAHLDP